MTSKPPWKDTHSTIGTRYSLRYEKSTTTVVLLKFQGLHARCISYLLRRIIKLALPKLNNNIPLGSGTAVAVTFTSLIPKP